ncbi:WD40 repeat [Macleaya cordata]|uniref:WD40 repeat n=1 Tax=Macleaya cordata TaxID=56857 RepID=A0A200QQH4_MACCD|nr:WD40 repeat [Macleaya cordata]
MEPTSSSPMPRVHSSDWLSPTSYDFPGDRFIPNRSLMDLDHAISLLTFKKSNSPASSIFNEEYRRKVEEVLKSDSEGRPFKMLVFRGRKVSERPRIRHIDEMKQQDLSEERIKNTNPPRRLPTRAFRVLDAPTLNDDYYLNLIDWGTNNVLAVALGSQLYLWNASNTNIQGLMETDSDDGYPTSVAWSENAKTIAVGLSSSKLQLWDAEKFQLVRSLEGHSQRVGCLAWKGQSLTSGSKDNSIINHDVRVRNSLISRIRAHTKEVCGLKWSSGGNQLASGGNDNTVCIWEASNMGSSRRLQRFTDHRAAVKALGWCPHQFDILASGGGLEDRCIKIWNSQTGKCINSIDTEAQICGLEWNRHQKEILSGHGFSQNRLCLWKYPSMSKLADLMGHKARILNLSQSPDGSTVVTAGADETLRFWNVFEPPKTTKMTDKESPLSLERFHIR